MGRCREPFLAEIRIVGFNFAPRGWATCDGQILPINQNQSLYSLLGTTYGGDGRTTFALPDLRGRTPIHVSSSVPRAGTEERRGDAHPDRRRDARAHAHACSGSGDNATVRRTPGGRVPARAT